MSHPVYPAARPSATPPQTIWIFERLLSAYVGLDDSNVPSAIFPLSGRMPVVGRALGAIRMEFQSNVRVEFEGDLLLEGCAIVACEDRTLIHTFGTLVEALATDLQRSTTSNARDFMQFLGNWERLFQRRRRLSIEEEKGLWGELIFISSRPSVDNAVSAWQGPRSENFDFQVGGVAFEVKTSSHFGLHRVSHQQVVQAAQRGRVFLVSQWVVEDTRHGLSLGELVDRVTDQISDKIGFEEKLMETGYSRADARLYDRKFILLDDPFLFDMFDVPRVRSFDAGVLHLSYSVQLNRGSEVAELERLAILENAFG